MPVKDVSVWGCAIREERIHTALPVQVVMTRSEHAMKQIAYTLDVSRRGARLAGVKGVESTGQFITVKRNANEGRFRVVWIGRPRSPQEGQIGIECLDCEKVIWDVDFAKAREDFQPIGMAGPSRLWQSARQREGKSEDYSCSGTAYVWAEEIGVQRLEAQLTRLGLDGCQIESSVPLPLNTVLLLHLHIGEIQLTVKGIRHEKDVASGAWIELTHIRRGDRLILEGLIARLGAGKTD
jgi:hypothetical protein